MVLMYGSNVYNIRAEFQSMKIFFLKMFFILFGMGLSFFLLKQLSGIPFDFLLQNMRSLTSGETVSLKETFLKNQFVKSVTVFVTGIVGLFSQFANEIKEMISEQSIKK